MTTKPNESGDSPELTQEEIKRQASDLLGVSENSTANEIKKAYHQLGLKYHPDRNKEIDSHIIMQEINRAYRILTFKDGESNSELDDALRNQQGIDPEIAAKVQADRDNQRQSQGGGGQGGGSQGGGGQGGGSQGGGGQGGEDDESDKDEKIEIHKNNDTSAGTSRNLREELEEGLLSPATPDKSPAMRDYKVKLRARILDEIKKTTLKQGENARAKAEEISKTVFVDFTVELLTDLLKNENEETKVELLKELAIELGCPESEIPPLDHPLDETKLEAFYKFIAEFLKKEYNFFFMGLNRIPVNVFEGDSMNPDIAGKLNLTFETYYKLFPNPQLQASIEAFQTQNKRPPYTKTEIFKFYKGDNKDALKREFEENLKELYRVVQNFQLYLTLKNPLAIKLQAWAQFHNTEKISELNSLLSGCNLLYRNRNRNNPIYYTGGEVPIWTGYKFANKTPVPPPLPPPPPVNPKNPNPYNKHGKYHGHNFQLNLFGDDEYHEKLEEGKTSEAEIAQDRATRLERTKDALKAKLAGADVNTVPGRNRALNDAFDIVMQASNQVMLDRQTYRINKQNPLQRGFNSVREGFASKYPKASFFVSAAARVGLIVGAAALVPNLAPLVAFGFTTAALRRPSAAMLAKFRRSKPSHTSAYSNLAIMQQMEIRKTTVSQVSPGSVVNPHAPLSSLDNSLYQGYEKIAKENQDKLKKNVKKKINLSPLFAIASTATPQEKIDEMIRIMMEEQEAIFRQMETERDKLTRVRVAEWLGAAAMAGLLAWGMSFFTGGGEPDTPPPKPTPIDPPPVDPLPVPPVVPEVPMQSFTGDFSTAQQVWDPTHSLLDKTSYVDLNSSSSLTLNPGGDGMVSELAGKTVQVNTLHDGNAGRLFVRDPSDVSRVIGKLNPGSFVELTGKTEVCNITQSGGSVTEPMRMFQAKLNGRLVYLAGSYLKI